MKTKLLLLLSVMFLALVSISCESNKYIDFDKMITVESVTHKSVDGEWKYVYSFTNYGRKDSKGNENPIYETDIHFRAISSHQALFAGEQLLVIDALKKLHNDEIINGILNQSTQNLNNNNNINIVVGQDLVRGTNDLLLVFQNLRNKGIAIGDTVAFRRY